ncbi:superoxide dismutase [Neisseria sicca]|uniref:Superoxide dismutase n=1 Tax=Neisseria sicca TaxID=490 RepID=A0A2I1XB11_NEISI|nr:superoxide dismutase [Neisseria sicca]
MGFHFSIHPVGEAHATCCCNDNLSLPPSGGGRLGWGWLLRFG